MYAGFSNSQANNTTSNLLSKQQQQLQSPPPIPSVPPPVSPLSPTSSDIIGRKTERKWSTNLQTMAATVETTLRQWSAPIQRDVEGQPPQQCTKPGLREKVSKIFLYPYNS
uniref:Uncharacterized protein n=1 Tax=Syphacia muris TaxID=451379 RepID=A0A0N5ARW7_9BILA